MLNMPGNYRAAAGTALVKNIAPIENADDYISIISEAWKSMLLGRGLVFKVESDFCLSLGAYTWASKLWPLKDTRCGVLWGATLQHTMLSFPFEACSMIRKIL
jgi:hypothetical protein